MTEQNPNQPQYDQGKLFEDSVEPNEATELLRQPEPPTAKGAAVSISGRTYLFNEAISEINLASKMHGLQRGVQTSHRSRIGRGYRPGELQGKVEGAEHKERIGRNRAAQYITSLAAPRALIAAGFPENEVSAVKEQMLRDFTSRYGVGVTDAKTRNRAAAKIVRTARKPSS